MNEERRAELDRLLAQSDSLIADFFASAPEPPDDVEELLEDSRADAAARLDPSLFGLRNSQYIIRLRRDDGRDLDIDGPSVRDVMAGIENEVDVAAPGARGEARIELDSLTRGSVVLNYRAVKPVDDIEDGQFDHGLSAIDSAIGLVTDLHRAFEEGLPVAQIVKIAAPRKGLLAASKALLEALDGHELNASTRWRNFRGEKVGAQLTKAAKDHAAYIFERELKGEPIEISGMLIEMSLKGGFTLQASKQYEVAPSEDFAANITNYQLGDYVHALVQEEKLKDKAGLESMPKYRLIRIEKITTL